MRRKPGVIKILSTCQPQHTDTRSLGNIITILQGGKLRLREDNEHAQIHTTSKEQKQHANRDGPSAKRALLAHSVPCSTMHLSALVVRVLRSVLEHCSPKNLPSFSPW